MTIPSPLSASPASASRPLKTLAIAVSGGLDSVLAYFYARLQLGLPDDEIVCVFLDLGQPYAAKERRALAQVGVPVTEVAVPLCALQGLAPTPEDAIIPARNLVIAALLAPLAEVVWIVGNEEDMAGSVSDKCRAFYDLATRTCTQALGRPCLVDTPFELWSKTEMIAWGQEFGLDRQMHETVSCYHPTEARCGACKVCAQRFLAFLCADLDTSAEYTRHPLGSPEATKLIARYQNALIMGDFSRYTERRATEHLAAYHRYTRAYGDLIQP